MRKRARRDTRGFFRAVIAIVLAMIAVALLARVHLSTHVPGLEQAPPREIPVAVVGPAPDASIMRDALNATSDRWVAARISSSEESARQDLAERHVSAVIMLGDTDTHELLTAGAASRIEAERVAEAVTSTLAVSGQRVQVIDAFPADPRDLDGVTAFRLGMGWVTLGIIVAGILGLVFGARSAGRTLAVQRFVFLAVASIVAGLGGALLSDIVFDRFDTPFWPLAAFGALVVMAVGAVTLAAVSLFGGAGLVPVTALFLIAGGPGALGAWPLRGLDTAWSTVLAWLPPGAAAWSIRSIVYFDGGGILRVVLLFAAWIAFGLAVSVYAATAAGDDRRMARFHPLLRRRPISSLLGGAVALAIFVVAPAAPSFRSIDRTPPLTVTCEEFSRPTSVDDVNAIVNDNLSTEEFVGGDVGASTPLSDDRTLFVYGDTIRRGSYSSTTMVRNSMLLFTPRCVGAIQRRDRGAIIPDRADGVGYWPMSIASAEVDGHDLVGVMAQRVRQTGTQAFEFENLGPALATFRVESGAVPTLQRVVDLGPDDASSDRPAWGAATAVESDTVYLYGTHRPEGEFLFGWALSVARTTLQTVSDQSAWEYWDGQRWQSDPTQAIDVIPPTDGVSQTLSVFQQGDTWYALSKRSDFVGTDLVVWTAPTPTGPFIAQPPLAKIPSTTDQMRYMPLAHPALLPQEGTMVVSVSRNTLNSDEISEDPTLYRPEFLRVDLPSG